jgi:putative FmdB family regulatory protein
MPIYDYRCSSCGHKFEYFTFKLNGKQINCENCGEIANRIISPVGIIFKGSGFYVTDSKKSSCLSVPDTDSKSDTDSKPDTGSKSEKKETDSKSEKKDKNLAAA